MPQSNMPEATLEGVRILFRNFAGNRGRFNREGDRNFNVALDDEIAERMVADGWNVKYLRAREEGDEPQPILEVAVNFRGRPPRIVLITSRGKTPLTEDTVALLDWAEIKNVDLIIRPYEWDVDGRKGVKAYLKSMFVEIHEDALELKYSDVPDSPDSAQNTLIPNQDLD